MRTDIELFRQYLLDRLSTCRNLEASGFATDASGQSYGDLIRTVQNQLSRLDSGVDVSQVAHDYLKGTQSTFQGKSDDFFQYLRGTSGFEPTTGPVPPAYTPPAQNPAGWDGPTLPPPGQQPPQPPAVGGGGGVGANAPSAGPSSSSGAVVGAESSLPSVLEPAAAEAEGVLATVEGNAPQVGLWGWLTYQTGRVVSGYLGLQALAGRALASAATAVIGFLSTPEVLTALAGIGLGLTLYGGYTYFFPTNSPAKSTNVQAPRVAGDSTIKLDDPLPVPGAAAPPAATLVGPGNQDTNSAPQVNQNSNSVPRVNQNSNSAPRVNQDTNSAPRVNQDTNSAPRVNQDTNSAPRVNQDTNSAPQVNQNSNSAPRVNRNSNSAPRVNQNSNQGYQGNQNSGSHPRNNHDSEPNKQADKGKKPIVCDPIDPHPPCIPQEQYNQQGKELTGSGDTGGSQNGTNDTHGGKKYNQQSKEQTGSGDTGGSQNGTNDTHSGKKYNQQSKEQTGPGDTGGSQNGTNDTHSGKKRNSSSGSSSPSEP